MSSRRGRSARDAGIVGVATTISRILGVVREQVFATLFGASPVMDAFRVAFAIPNVLRDLFAEGALNPAFVPIFTEYSARDSQRQAWRLVNLVVNALVVLLGIFVLAVIVFAPQLVELYEGGFDATQSALATTMTRIIAPFIVFVSLYAVLMGALNARNRFFAPALAPAVFNVVNILAGLLLVPVFRHFGQPPILGMAVGVLLGGFGQFAIQVPQMWRQGWRYRWELSFSDPGVRRIGALMLPAAISLGATQLSFAININLASSIGTGAVSWLGYAFRLIYVPIGLFGIAIATVNLRDMSVDVARQDPEALRRTIAGALKTLMLLTVPSTLGLMVLARPIIRVLYQHGAFSATDTENTAQALVYYTLGLFAYSCIKVLVPAFYATGAGWIPVAGSLIAMSASIALQFLLIDSMLYRGLALATAAGSFGNSAFLYWQLTRKLGSMRNLGVGSTLLRVSLASLAMGGACAALYAGLQRWLSPALFWSDLVNLALCIVAGIGVYALGCVLLRVQEVADLGRALRSRGK